MPDKRNGTARFTDFGAYLAWYSAFEQVDSTDAVYAQLRDATASQREPCRTSDIDRAISEMFEPQGSYGGFQSRTRAVAWQETHQKAIARIRQFHEFSSEYGQPLKVGIWVDNSYAFLYLGNPSKGIIVPTPERYLEYIPEADLFEVTPAELRAMLSVPIGAEGQSIVPSNQQGCLTEKGLSEKLEENKSEIDKLKQEAEDIENAKSGELAVLQAQIDTLMATLEEKKQNLMAQLQEKMVPGESHWIFYRAGMYEDLAVGDTVAVLISSTELRRFSDIGYARNIYPDDLKKLSSGA